MTFRVAFLLSAGALVLGGCWFPDPAYMFAVKPKEAVAQLRLESVPSGAEARASFGMSCHTPCILPMGGGGEFTVTFVRHGYLPQTVPVWVGGVLIPLTVVPNPVVARLVRDPNVRVIGIARTRQTVEPVEVETEAVAPETKTTPEINK